MKKQKKRRPTARDREIAEWIAKMDPKDKWRIEVDVEPHPRGFARLKREGMMRMEFDNTVVTIWPEIK